MTTIKDNLLHWIPQRLALEHGATLCRWLYMKNIPFTDPFFDETIMKCKLLPENSKMYRSTTSIGMLAEWSEYLDYVPPTAFIFHVSRCGSTLVSQALGINSANISLSEVRLFDELLKLPVDQCPRGYKINEIITGAIRFYGAKRNLREDRLFIKTDSWHLFYYKKIRALYPQVPFIILYREPGAVLESNKIKIGMQGVPGTIDASFLGFEEDNKKIFDRDNYMARVLEKYYGRIIEIVENDEHTLLLDYKEGLSAMMQKIARFTGMQLSGEEKKNIAERSLYDAKSPAKTFVEKTLNTVNKPHPGLSELYDHIDSLKA